MQRLVTDRYATNTGTLKQLHTRRGAWHAEDCPCGHPYLSLPAMTLARQKDGIDTTAYSLDRVYLSVYLDAERRYTFENSVRRPGLQWSCKALQSMILCKA